jgi:SAM-dependent methyltransferase
VIEHIEHCRRSIREIYRVLKQGGLVVVTTPNILNLKSRMRYLCFGFHNLFGPLHVHESAIYNSDGHINPISYFYLAHALLDANFTALKLGVDKLQRSSIGLLFPLWMPIKLAAFFMQRTERLKFKTIDEINEPLVKAINSKEILLGRTIVVAASKPKGVVLPAATSAQ